MEEILIGIDFGACNLKCVHVKKNKISAVRLNTNDDGSFHTPNAIFYNKTKSGAIDKIIGQAAIGMGTVNPENLIIGLKRKLEQKDWHQFIPSLEREVTATEVVEDIFKKIYAMATKNLDKDCVARAIVTVPVIFTKSQRKLIKDAATKAGFSVSATVNESFASIFAAKELDDSLNIIFDLGGSTLDISIIKISGNEVSELVSTGLRLGGLDIDRDILEKLLKPKYGEIIDAAWTAENKEDWQLNFVRRLKEAVYLDEAEDEICAENVEAKPNFDKIILKRDEIDDLLEREGYGAKIIAALDNLFDDLLQGDDCFDKSDVTKVWALGGSLRIPYFRTLLENYFGEELFSAQDYDFEDVDDFISGMEDKYLIVAGGAANFLKQKENIIATNSIPYRICYCVGKELRRGLEKNMPTSFETLLLPLNLSELEENGWRTDFYQSFSDEAAADESAYLGSVTLNPQLYEKKDNSLLTMKMLADGRLSLKISERRKIDGESKICLVERHFLNLED